MQTLWEDQRSQLRVEYVITSHWNIPEERKYVQHIYGEVILEDKDQREQLIGNIEAVKFLIGAAYNSKVPVGEVMAIDDETGVWGQKIYDYERGDWNRNIMPYMADAAHGADILILDHVELIPAFRGKHIGHQVIKDLYLQFISGCRLFVASLDAYRIEQSQEAQPPKAIERLTEFFRSIGFAGVPEVGSDLMFLNPAVANTLFHSAKQV